LIKEFNNLRDADPGERLSRAPRSLVRAIQRHRDERFTATLLHYQASQVLKL
jgi:hypothetical protein